MGPGVNINCYYKLRKVPIETCCKESWVLRFKKFKTLGVAPSWVFQ